MKQVQDRPSGNFSNLYNYASHDSNSFIKDWNYPDNGINGTGVDIVIIDTGVDALHHEFFDEDGNSRVQLVDWNYLAKHGDRLISNGLNGYNEWRAKDFSFSQINNYINHLITSHSNSNPSYAPYQYPFKFYFSAETSTYPGIGSLPIDIYTKSSSTTGLYDGYSSSIWNYIPFDPHGTHVAGTAAGKNIGWAHGARVYSISATGMGYSTTANRPLNTTDDELVYLFHLMKKSAGIDRPTIVNSSYGIPRAGNDINVSPREYNQIKRDISEKWDTIQSWSPTTYLKSTNPIPIENLNDLRASINTSQSLTINVEPSSYYDPADYPVDEDLPSNSSAGDILNYIPWFFGVTGSYSLSGDYEWYRNRGALHYFANKFKYTPDMFCFNNLFRQQKVGTIAAPNPYNAAGAFAYHPLWTSVYNNIDTGHIFRQRAIDEGVVWVFAAGNTHGIASTVEEVKQRSAFEFTGSGWEWTEQRGWYEYTGSAFPGYTYPTSSFTNNSQPWLEEDKAHLAPGFYAMTRSWDEFNNGSNTKVNSDVWKVGVGLYGDLPNPYLYDSRVICVGATQVRAGKDPHAWFRWNQDPAAKEAGKDVHGAYKDVNTQDLASLYGPSQSLWGREALQRGLNITVPGHTSNYYSASFTTGDHEHFPETFGYSQPYRDYWPSMTGSLGRPEFFAVTQSKVTLPVGESRVYDHKTNFSEAGSRIDIWAPGHLIHSARPYNFGNSTLTGFHWLPLHTMYDEAIRDIPMKSLYNSDGSVNTTYKQSIETFMRGTRNYFDNTTGKMYGYGTLSGTSMACPQVVGVLGLYAQLNKDIDVKNAKSWLQANAYNGYIPDTSKLSIFDNQSSEKTFDHLFGNQYWLERAMVPALGDSEYAIPGDTSKYILQSGSLDEETGTDTRAFTRYQSFPMWRWQQNYHFDRANIRALHGAPNKLLHWPYSSIYNTPDSFNFTDRNSKVFNNIMLTGSVALTNLRKEVQSGLTINPDYEQEYAPEPTDD